MPTTPIRTEPDTETRLAIQALTAEHAYRLDHGQADTLHELYTGDGELLGLPPKDLIGKEAISAWGIARAALPRTSRHIETNHRLHWEDDRLHGTLYATVHRSDTADTTDTAPFMVGDYEDEYALVDGRWRIRRRTIRRGFRVATPTDHSAHAAATMFGLDDLPFEEVRPGFARSAIRSDGALTTVNWFEPGFTTRGPHSHAFDQLSYVLAGAMRFYVGDDVFDLHAPAVVHIPGGLPHCAEPIGDERALNIDVFAPIREDYLPLCEHQGYRA